MLKTQTNIRKTYNYLIRALIIAVTYGFIYRQVFRHRKFEEILDASRELADHRNAWYLLSMVVLLMLINWGSETVKWRLLISKIEKISFLRAYKAVLTGVSISLFTPNRTGEFLGRIFILNKANHYEGVLITIIGSFAQITVIITCGLFAFLAYADHYILVAPEIRGYFITSLIFLVPAAVFFTLLVYFRIGLLSQITRRIFPGKWQKVADYIDVFSRFNFRELLRVLLISLFRYMVFSLQFYLLLRLFGADLPLSGAIILIPVIYLVMTLVPSVALVDLGIRGSVSLYVLGMYFRSATAQAGDVELSILAASTMLWFVNLIIPAILGTFFVFNLKFFRK